MQNRSQEPSNTVCPVCGSPVDERIPPVIAPSVDDGANGLAAVQPDQILRIGACSAECRTLVLDEPAYYLTAASENQVAVGG